jgi:hypothetical protein
MEWIVDLQPGALLANIEADGFYLQGQSGGATDREKVSLWSVMPNVSTGVGIPLENMELDLTGGVGLLLNQQFSSFMLQGKAAAHFEVKRAVTLGPHAALLYFTEPDWWGDGDADFSDTAGFMAGVHLTAGDKIAYMLSVDYLSASFDVDPRSGWIAREDDLDISGVAVQFGLRGRF